MTVVTAGPAAWAWSADVLAFARGAGVEGRLDELMRATRDLFPDAREVRVWVERDPENAAYDGVVWAVYVPMDGVEDYLEAKSAWGRAFRDVAPHDPAGLPAFYQQLIREQP